MRPAPGKQLITKRAADLEPGDVVVTWPGVRRVVLKVTGPWGSPPWVEVRFDPIYVNAHGVDERLDVEVEAA